MMHLARALQQTVDRGNTALRNKGSLHPIS